MMFVTGTTLAESGCGGDVDVSRETPRGRRIAELQERGESVAGGARQVDDCMGFGLEFPKNCGGESRGNRSGTLLNYSGNGQFQFFGFC